MAKSSPPADASLAYKLFSLVATCVVFGGLTFGAYLAVQAVQAGIKSMKKTLAGKGVVVSDTGVAVKTEQRATTIEETQDQMQAKMMQGWKHTSFNIPTLLKHGTGLSGSRHDKNKEAWEVKHEPKKHKTHTS